MHVLSERQECIDPLRAHRPRWLRRDREGELRRATAVTGRAARREVPRRDFEESWSGRRAADRPCRPGGRRSAI